MGAEASASINSRRALDWERVEQLILGGSDHLVDMEDFGCFLIFGRFVSVLAGLADLRHSPREWFFVHFTKFVDGSMAINQPFPYKIAGIYPIIVFSLDWRENEVQMIQFSLLFVFLL